MIVILVPATWPAWPRDFLIPRVTLTMITTLTLTQRSICREVAGWIHKGGLHDVVTWEVQVVHHFGGHQPRLNMIKSGDDGGRVIKSA